MSGYIGLLIAVFAVSWASLFIRWCGDTPALVISFYRLFWSTIIFLLYQFIRNPAALRYRNLALRDKFTIAIAGVFLALHFATWIASIQLTLISHSLVLESTHPVFALILSPLLLREKGSWQTIVAGLLTFVGILMIGGQDLHLAGGKFLGDLLALAGAVFVALYLIIARHHRSNIDLISYLILVYASATLTLFILVILSGHSFIDYSWQAHLFMFLLALIPTGIGHSLMNWAARKMPVYKVNFSILGEPIIASILAFIFFQEIPYGLFYLGALFILSGIFLSLFERKPVNVA
ncbi:MAG: DMT family transporter [Calditrichia bacterium]